MTSRRIRLARVAASAGWRSILFVVLLPLRSPAVSAVEPRFFFSGDGFIALQHAHFDERLAVRYRDVDGRYDPEALARIERFFRSRDDGQSGEVSLRLIELIDFVEDRYRPRRIVLISGYRSLELNQQLRASGARVADASLHREGLAADLQLDGVDLKRVWAGLRDLRVGGVGYYRQQAFLHLDTGRPRFWEPQTSRVKEKLSAGNARVFARTDFDRYRALDGALLRLHGVTALPLRIARHARFGARTVTLEPLGDDVTLTDGCYVFDQPVAAYRFRIAAAPSTAHSPAPSSEKGVGEIPQPIRVFTCAPRVAATPPEIESNPVELLLERRRREQMGDNE
ncbi:MAG: hypothetical protein A3J75_07545 [Acidobacteria bacterium RBG_16_68_9]|nr:MAG: hypothetical protein A3J75_07545 [Acidobacteria bacterium RBG_16_68_9]